MFNLKSGAHSKKGINMKSNLFKNLAIGLSVVVTALASQSVLANNVAVWNSQVAITNSNYARAKINAIQASVKPKQQQLESYKATVDRLQQQYVNQKDKLTDAQKDDLRKQIQSNLQNYEQVADQIQSTIEASEADVMQHVGPKIQSIRDGIIRQKNIDVLIDSRDRNVTFVKPEWDVTADFTKAINEQVK